ncbi:MAG: DNA adenine methylase [Myxococcota bacterium]|nr:DNA adenine methylase [Myxococcota bacterium]MDW8361953.1 DNA adenine methylase [Myxococcales bacterium]
MIKYLGSKRLLAGRIVEIARALPGVRTVLDPFSGSARIGHALKRAGFRVVASDHNAYAATLARCYVQADREEVARDAERLLRELGGLRGSPGYFTETYCIQSRFFHPKNGERIDAIREAIAKKGLPPELEAVVLTSLMEAADRVDSTVGLQMAYLKQWAPRALGDLELRMPDVLPRARYGKGEAHRADVLEMAACVEADLAYLDPPYNQHSYLSNYHVWETLVLWDKPDVYGRARKRIDCKTRKSPFNARATIHQALHALVSTVRARFLLVSFSDEGFVSRAELESLLQSRGHVYVFAHPWKRYVGAQIGIYNPRGEKVGRVGRRYNTEYLFLVSPIRLDAALASFGPSRDAAPSAPRRGVDRVTV